MNPISAFYAALTSPFFILFYFNKIETKSLTRVILHYFILTEEELMEKLSGSESEIIKIENFDMILSLFTSN